MTKKMMAITVAILVFSVTHVYAKIVADSTIARTSEGKRIYRTQRIQQTPPKIDGVLDDACWTEGVWSGHFKQFMPNNGLAPENETLIKILYDDENIYCAAKVYDDPELIDKTLERRDSFQGDMIGVCFDSYYDHRTGFEFNIAASGGKVDLLLGNENWDTNWNAVWDGKSAMSDSGWCAEWRIPLSQLRYSKDDEQVWGLHSWRWVNRNREEDQWALIPRDNGGHLYHIGELHGIKGLPQKRRVELVPYTVGKTHLFEKEVGNPFATGQESDINFGMDGKVGVGSDFTMDFTINPDFGQVEADPSDLNLTAFETFFEEKRPFFLEGKNIFDYDFGGASLFYSRRIGHRPSYYPGLGDGEYAQSPENTSILGAAKLSGKTKNGLSLGILNGVTAKENVEIDKNGNRSKETAEPLTNYFVSRVQKDINKSNTIIGGILTATNRNIQDKHLEFLNREAYTGGLDFRHHWKDKTYYVDAKAIFSHIQGSTEALRDLQYSSARYFQRPDADYVEFDSTLTQLSGHGGQIEFGKGANGRWRFAQEFSWNSPGLELNDLGFLRQTDRISSETGVEYVVTDPIGIVREYEVGAFSDNSWNFGRDFLGTSVGIRGNAFFENKWGLSGRFMRVGDMFNTSLLRGGPGVNLHGWYDHHWSIRTDHAKKVAFSFSVHHHNYDDDESYILGMFPALYLKLTNAMQLSARFERDHRIDMFQYVGTFGVNGSNDYVLAKLNQKTYGLTLRLDYSITPNLTFQYYGSPYIAMGKYNNFKRIVDPSAKNYDKLYHQFEGDEIVLNENNEYEIDNDTYRFGNPNFNFREFRSNLVMRYEYKPGSVFYLVWTHGRSSWENVTNNSISDNWNTMANLPVDNVFLVKFNYWFNL